MAKYSRYDPRNKKRGKHKVLHQDKDVRIKEVDIRNTKQSLNEVMYDDEYDYDEYEPRQLQE
jgi:hypothetical protein